MFEGNNRRDTICIALANETCEEPMIKLNKGVCSNLKVPSLPTFISRDKFSMPKTDSKCLYITEFHGDDFIKEFKLNSTCR